MNCPHPDHLGQILNARQLAEWRAFDNLEAIGDRRQDLRIANLCHYLLAAWVPEYDGKPEDFVLSFSDETETVDRTEAQSALDRLNKLGDEILAG